MSQKLLEIAIFTYQNDADILESIFQRENIEYFMKDKNSSNVIPGFAAGGIGLVVNEKDVKRAIEIIKESGFGGFLAEPQEI